jgi:hypothetical protein
MWMSMDIRLAGGIEPPTRMLMPPLHLSFFFFFAALHATAIGAQGAFPLQPYHWRRGINATTASPSVHCINYICMYEVGLTNLKLP